MALVSKPQENMMDIPGMADEMRCPMTLIVSANKKEDSQN